ncbi:uncharacterized protein LOC133966169 isoform X2 [Platichthys flesus]|uniref:uncharacterized protein LOC133966169 isoform X2 n=1 Tax=Platichthys flesus TaxID=8260 RepID=UPI002DB5D7FD|nr:uncharacterized protein LOC133966169 isoform X2 [Platichthys flesus]
MSAFKSLVVWILIMWTFTTADDEVSCVLEESCILPCSFQPGTDPVIYWTQVKPGNTHVHSYNSDRDQFARQGERFRGRTSLFTDQISRGNASIRLTGLKLQDLGRYECYTNTITGVHEESFINLRADAPVRHVDIEQVEDSFTCRSEGIYPEPQLTWSTRPPSNFTLQSQTTVKETEQQLYEISSTLTLSDRDTVLICSISTRHGRRSAVWYQPTPVLVSPFKTTTIHCTAPNTKPPTHWVWKFNHRQIIVNRTGADGLHSVSEQWRQQVEDVSASGSLTLHHLSSDHQGTFTCELSSEEETHFINSYVTIDKDDEVSCVLEESCILPCSFQPGPDPVIYWTQVKPGNTHVHSYNSDRDQFVHQGEHFRGRTSLFTDQISRGNASIRLTGLQLQDQGRYECYTSTITGVREVSIINLRAAAPVRHVDIEQVEDSFTCRSEGIYPEPQLTWSTRPPSNLTLQSQTTVKETEQQLYEINSTLTLSDRDTVLICSISTRHGRRSAVWYQPTPVRVSPFKTTTIHCTAPNTKPLTHCVWKFNRRQIIVNQTGVDGLHSVSEQWRQQVEDVSASGSLTLHHLSSDHQGTFTCELSSEEETHFINSYVTIDKGSVAAVVVGVLVVCVALGTGAGFYYFRRLKILQRTHLKLNGYELCETHWEDVASALMSDPSHLTELDLSDNELQESGVKELLDLQKSSTCRLETLRWGDVSYWS